MKAIQPILAGLAIVLLLTATGRAQREEFTTPRNGNPAAVWRLTHEPACRDWANYHNTQCWSHDGRFVTHTRWNTPDGKGGDDKIAVHVFDLQANEDRHISTGFDPRWARHRNHLFFSHIRPDGGRQRENAVEVRWYDADSGQLTTLAQGVEHLGEPSFDDAWLYGAKRFRGQTPEHVPVRIPIRAGAVAEDLPEVFGAQWQPNPRHPVFFTRKDHKDEAFGGTRFFFDLDGSNPRLAVPTIFQCHMSWQGNGEHLLLGNGFVRGLRWNEPYPGNIHILSTVRVGDVSPCGLSGRYVCGDAQVADLRSGGGWHTLDPLSVICFAEAAGDVSTTYDADPKGSPDGTKIAFVSTYDLKDGPLAVIREDFRERENVLHVDSTAGFPEQGLIEIKGELIAYESKTDTGFIGLARNQHGTRRFNLYKGRIVTSFAARLLSDAAWERLGGVTPNNSMRRGIEAGSPLLRQRQTDVYVVVARLPDRPVMRVTGAMVELIPGEEHRETFGYHLLRDGAKITQAPLRPGARLRLEQPGEYRAVAVEWSGLESAPGLPVKVGAPMEVGVLAEAPADFSWTRDRWLLAGNETTEEAALSASASEREILHRHDGVIHREWFERGMLRRRHDLDAEGRACRRLEYDGSGRLRQREYADEAGLIVSREIFDDDGFITERQQLLPGRDGAPEVADHWWFERGVPVRRVSGRDEFVKRGEQWIGTRSGKAVAR